MAFDPLADRAAALASGTAAAAQAANAAQAARRAASGVQGLAADGASLNGLKRAARDDPQAAIKQAAVQFEALFMQTLLKKMREASPKSGMLSSEAEDTYTGMLDQQMAVKMASSSTGLAAMIAKQLARGMAGGNAPALSPSLSPSPVPIAAPAALKPAAVSSRPTPGQLPPSAAIGAGAAAAALPQGATAVGQAQKVFVARHASSAAAAEKATGIPARFVLGQAALESGWGRFEIRSADGRPTHNLFGIKAGATWKGATVEVATTEYSNGVAGKRIERFRAYPNYDEAFKDWGRLMAEQPRYAAVLRAGGSAEGFAHGLQRAGYATDPAYGNKLLRVIRTADAAGADLRGSSGSNVA